ncbi:MAG TPA: hypothetical protein PKH07_18425, partial [bacterium]|nr:hypothetical protein [bacterium]
MVLKAIPDEPVLKFNFGSSYSTQVTNKDDFLSYKGGGVNLLGREDRDIPSDGNFGGAAGLSSTHAPYDGKWSLAAGGKRQVGDITVGGFGSLFYERDSSSYRDGIDDKYWVEHPGDPMTPQYVQGSPDQGDFKTQLFDVQQSAEEVKWGGLGTLGLEVEDHALTLLYMYTRTAEDVATLAEDTRGKEFYFPGYDPNDPRHPGNQERDAAPYLRMETLEYTERTTQTLQLRGRHTLLDPDLEIKGGVSFLAPEFDWLVAQSSSGLLQPDKRQFGSLWWAESYNPGYPPYLPPSTYPSLFRPFKPAANFTMGNFQRIWKDISEDSTQYQTNLKIPFEQWSGDEGYLKFGIFKDQLKRSFQQDSFSNFNDNSAQYSGDWDDFWSDVFPDENHPVTAAAMDVDYEGEQDISAWYVMEDVPL